GGRRGARPPPHPAKPPQPGAAVAEDALPQADGQALPEETEGQPASAGVRAALAGGKRVLPAQAAARLGPWCQVGRLARARVLPARAHPQHHAPRSYRIEGFNRATKDQKSTGLTAPSFLCPLYWRSDFRPPSSFSCPVGTRIF